ncbi:MULTISPECIES: helix-turn-helix transcriptional regulator [Acidaminococcus]|uniref:Helix-turn-helix transcriptional regulator n=1 Tax=Acidaminococcus fermentans TaxID=905 RepID=A0A6N7VZD4_ACIFE|nr:helix-turn-helix transcriptional regulator [Acidaminococcus fermentans]MSS82511.1 helix-turn-helix transcriptional regulator [Acidaminococcus fermentans]
MGNRYKGLEIRKQRGLTQDELCERAGLSRQTLYELEKGIKTDVKMSTLTALASALECSVSDLFAENI